MHLKGANRIAASGLDYRKALVGTGWAISLHCLNQLRKAVLWSCGASVLSNDNFFSVCTGGHWLRAMTIENLLMSGCGLSHKSAEGGYKGS